MSNRQLKDVSLEFRSPDMCDFGAKTKEVLHQLKKDKNRRLALLHKDLMKFFQSSTLQQKLPLTNVVLQTALFETRLLH